MKILKEKREQKVIPEMAANRIVQNLQHAIGQLESCHQQCEQVMNKNPHGFTKKKVTDALGEDATEVKELHAKIGEFLKSLQ